ncbi:glycosyltransferase family 2 protein [Rufibacter tibetensis]|uniref:Spore coat polysaccharide biosynthesis protein spsA n=1 Tax=Rufibacter tibetensis TaxID=512763 RepID=A0A0N7HWQ5_9BACT|nr:glycosyltransferase family A protein [Rufibacter tibetensis]ALI99904.1 spore coat polysaccharide biosynthesis protein spsA [Rufibacter tibetensis]
MSIASFPLVSVIIPFMNEEKYLSEAIESVLQQDFTDWELLLVDDGSTNGSTLIAKDYAAKYPDKIFYIEHEGHINKGATVSRNLGVEKSKGALIALLDADDTWLPQKLSIQTAVFKSDPSIEMVAEASLYWFSWCDPSKEDILIPVGVQPDKVYGPGQLMLNLYPLEKGDAPCPSALLVKKSAILKVGGFEESFIKQYQLYEDQAFLCKIYLNCTVYISSACNNLYRQRPDSTVYWVKEKGHYHVVRKYFLEWLQAYMKKQGLQNKEVLKLLKRALLPYHHPLVYRITHILPQAVVQYSKRLLATSPSKV